MVALACPQCAQPIAGGGRCGECGFDASLLSNIRRAAERLAHQAAERAAGGGWQEAYDTAAESLRFVREQNDLAAFVLLVASLAGARGSVAAVPRPRAAALPAPLAPWVDEVLDAAGQLRALGARSASPVEIQRALRELDPRHPLLPDPVPSRRRRWLVPATAVAVALPLAAIAGLAGRWNGAETTRQQMQGRIAALDNALRRARQAPPPGASPPAVVPAPPLDPWLRALQGLPPRTQTRVQDSVSREAWHLGRAASRRGRYEQARKYLELAAQGPRGSDYWDAALYYLGKAYHRLGRPEEARAAYQRLEREAPHSTYLPEARRLLGRLERGQGVER
jgi:tetratricopeptide (TPR) repeat protein